MHENTQSQQNAHLHRHPSTQIALPLCTGKGVGMRACQDFRSGDLIGAFPPLSVVYGPAGSTPENEALADAIVGQQLSLEQLR